MRALTERQQQVLSFLVEYRREYSRPPTFREIAAHFAVGMRTVQDHINALKKKGAIETAEKNSARCIRVLERHAGGPEFAVANRVPLIGSAAAGKPLLCEENFEGYVSVPSSALRPGQKYFALRVRGDSMSGAGILDGDVAIIEQRPAVENGQIAAVVVEDGAVIKRFYKEAARIRLHSENPAYDDLFVTNARVVGKLARIERYY